MPGWWVAPNLPVTLVHERPARPRSLSSPLPPQITQHARRPAPSQSVLRTFTFSPFTAPRPTLYFVLRTFVPSHVITLLLFLAPARAAPRPALFRRRRVTWWRRRPHPLYRPGAYACGRRATRQIPLSLRPPSGRNAWFVGKQPAGSLYLAYHYLDPLLKRKSQHAPGTASVEPQRLRLRLRASSPRTPQCPHCRLSHVGPLCPCDHSLPP
jgi:hypothetical protein